MAAASSPGTSSTSRWRPSRTTSAPDATTCLTSAAVPAANTAASGSLPPPASRGESRDSVTRSAYAPGTISPASGQPRQAFPPTVAAVTRSAALKCPRRLVTRRWESSSQRASSKQVDDAVPVAAERERRPGGGKRRGGAHAVGEVGLGERAHADRRQRAAEQVHVQLGQVRGVYQRRARAERPRVVENLGRRTAEGGHGTRRSPAAAPTGARAQARHGRATRP